MSVRTDVDLMRLALLQAQTALDAGQFPVGAIIALEGRVIASAHNQSGLLRGELAHAELNAIRKCEDVLADHFDQCTLYTTLEPCFMCFGAMAHYRFKRLVCALPDPHAGALAHRGLSPYHATRVPEVTIGLLKHEAFAMFDKYSRATGRENHAVYMHPDE